jgi:hypothetical protein
MRKEEYNVAALFNSKGLGLKSKKSSPFYKQERWALGQKFKDNGPMLRQPYKKYAQPGSHICESRSILETS